MKTLSSGINSPLECANIKIKIHCSMSIAQQGALDVSAFLLSSNGKVRSDNDFIFYNQPQAKDKSITLVPQNNETQFFNVDLNSVHSDIQKISFVITSPVAFLSASALSIEVENFIHVVFI